MEVRGQPKDPQSNGRLCPRGTGAVGAHYDPDRLQKPLIRVGARGSQEWKAVTWDEAFTYIAERMHKIKAEHGPESIVMFNHGVGVRFIQHVLKSWGCTGFAGPSFAQCRGPRDVGFTLTFGVGLGSPEPTDIKNTDCLTLIGSHLGENMHNLQVQEFAQAVERRVPIIVVDPRFSVAASKARHWLPIMPGTDLALLLAWMDVLVTEGGTTTRSSTSTGTASTSSPPRSSNTGRVGRRRDRPSRSLIRATARRWRAVGRRRSFTPGGASTGTATTRNGVARSRCVTG